jgi:hypothetical protein
LTGVAWLLHRSGMSWWWLLYAVMTFGGIAVVLIVARH